MMKTMNKMGRNPLKTLDKVSNIGIDAANKELDKAAQEASRPRGKSSFVDSQSASIAKAGRKMIAEDMAKKGIANNMASNMANKASGIGKNIVSDKLKEARGAAKAGNDVANKAVDKVLRKKMGGAAKTCSRNYTSKKRTLHSLY